MRQTLQHLVNARRLPQTLTALAAMVLLCAASAQWVASVVVLGRFSQLLQEGQRLSDQLSHNSVHTINQDMALVRGIPAVLSEVPQVQQTLSDLSTQGFDQLTEDAIRRRLAAKPDVQALDTLLQATRNYFGVEFVRLDTVDGYCIASSDGSSAASRIGSRHENRDYFRQALLGGRGEQYVVGPASKTPGIFFSSPVYHNGELIGVAVVKLGMTQLSHWVETDKSFITDRNGVIILANDPEFLHQAVPGAPVLTMNDQERVELYGARAFPVLPIETYKPPRGVTTGDTMAATAPDRLITFGAGGSPYLINETHRVAGDLTVYTVTKVADANYLAGEHKRYTMLLTGLFMSLSGIATLTAFYVNRGRRHLSKTLELNAALAYEAKYDHLTGALTRRHFLKRLKLEMDKAKHESQPAALMLMDMDHFKTINDTWGHAAGDAVLAAFVRICQSVLRGNDICGRLGGEEFAIILSGSTEQAALDAAERLRETIRTTSVATEGRQIRFTASAGIAALNPDDDEKDWLRRADAALYYAKAHGRNQSVRFGTLPLDEREAAANDYWMVGGRDKRS